MNDAALSPDTTLQLAAGIRARLGPDGHVLAESPIGTVVDAGPRGFELLALFSTPITLGDVIERLENELAGTTELAPSINLLNLLIEEGIVEEPGAGRGPTSGWADPVEHGRMLHDDRRTLDYLAAIRKVVRPGDVVIDLGTGSGVLATAAARAGAKQVYALEASDIADVAEEVFRRNGVDGTVALVRGSSRTLELPEPADVLVAEIIGNEPFEEDILESTVDARTRFLRPNARMIPEALALLARPLLIPEEEARQRALGATAVERWRALYDIDFEPLVEAAVPGPAHHITEGEVAVRWRPVGPATVLHEIDLTTVEDVAVNATADLVVDAPGAVNGVAVTFRAQLSSSVVHELDPWRWTSSSWAVSVWVLPDTLELDSGCALRVGYRRRVPGEPDGLTVEVVDSTP
jgi:protein arginine N-methyltransferase 1